MVEQMKLVESLIDKQKPIKTNFAVNMFPTRIIIFISTFPMEALPQKSLKDGKNNNKCSQGKWLIADVSF